MIKLFFYAIPHLGVVISLIWCMFTCIKEFLSIFAVVANGEMRNKDTYWMKEKGYIPRTYPIVFVIFLLCIKVSACWAYRDHRNRKVDSLEVVLRQPGLSWEDQLRAHSELMWGYIQTDGAKSIAHAKEIIKLTEKARGEGLLVRQNAFRILGQHAYGACLYDSAFHCYERSLEVTRQAEKSGRYSQEEIDDMYSALYGTIGNLYNIQGMPNIAMDYYLKALPIFQRYGWNESVSTLYWVRCSWRWATTPRHATIMNRPCKPPSKPVTPSSFPLRAMDWQPLCSMKENQRMPCGSCVWQ